MSPRSRPWCAALVGGALLGCAPPGAFECQSDPQCDNGRCEPTGWCSFPDETCESGHRYGGLAGEGLAGRCVPVNETDTGTSTNGSSASASGSSSVTTPSMTEPTSPSDSTDPATSDATTESDDDAPASCGNGTVNGDEDCDDGNQIDGDGCDADCTPSGETIWEYASGEAGNDVARDVVVFEGFGIVVCGDGSDESIPFAALFADDGTPSTIDTLDDIGPANAWGIAASDELVVVGGHLIGPVERGFVVTQSTETLDLVVFEVPMVVYDVALANDVVWVSGRLGGVPSVAAFTTTGDPVDDTDPSAALPAAGVAWDLSVDARGTIHVAGVDDDTGRAWIGSIVSDGGLSWSTTWPMLGSGAAYGMTAAPDGAVIASGSFQQSGVLSLLDAADGTERWSVQLSSDRGPFANVHKAAPGPSGEVVGVGWIATSETDADIWVGKYSPDGDLLWERTFAGTGAVDSDGWGVVVDDAGFITAVGGIYDAMTEYDAWVVHLEP